MKLPRLLAIALLVSLSVHLLLLFGAHYEFFDPEDDPEPLQAVLQPPPPGRKPVDPVPAVPKKMAGAPRRSEPPVASTAAATDAIPEKGEMQAPPAAEKVPEAAAQPHAEPGPEAAPAKPLLPASGAIRFVIHKESLNLLVGQSEHRWEFTGDGQYHLSNVTETSGVVSLFKPIRIRAESHGRLVAGGLRPDSYRTWRNGEDNREGADFDWTTGLVRLARNDSEHPVVPGMQDLLSLSYQLGYLEHPEAGGDIALATVRKVEHYRLDSLGEEDVETPAGRFHTLHMRVQAATTTEIWMALDLYRLPVKIRYTDKKGDSFIQVATEIGSLTRNSGR